MNSNILKNTQVKTNKRNELIAIFTDFRSQHRRWEGRLYDVHCCAGIAIDLLNEISRDLHFDYDLYMVADGLFGVRRNKSWDGITGDIVNDLAHLSFTAFSTTSSRVQVCLLFLFSATFLRIFRI